MSQLTIYDDIDVTPLPLTEAVRQHYQSHC